MQRAFLFALILLVSAAWVNAQSDRTGSSPSGNNSSGQTSSEQSGYGQTSSRTGQTSDQTKIEGCLQGSEGRYTLNHKTGTTYQLVGDTSKLSKHVGHEVEITGSTSGSAPGSTPGSMNPNTGAGTATGASQTLNVDHVKHVSTSCKHANK